MTKQISLSGKYAANKLLTLLSSAIITATLALTPTASAITIIPDAPQINAKGFILIDYTTGKIIAEENADTQLAPASLTKIMTSYIIGKELESGNINNTDKVMISENAWAKKFPDSSKMFIEVGT
ncbi:MAG: D-alanyl-D-alanine carboxypeptidase, partial [Alteromonadales bacterium]|nr:D-alanyl-D-alanine carboxypeptidase [Alteromonadales bacterium]